MFYCGDYICMLLQSSDPLNSQTLLFSWQSKKKEKKGKKKDFSHDGKI